MTTRERYLSQVTNVIKSLTEQYYMGNDEYFGIANSLFNDLKKGVYSDDYIYGYTDALRKVGEFFNDKA